MGRQRKEPLYVLPHGVQVIGEYAPKGQNRYWRVRIRPHAFFPNVAVVCGGCYVRRSRVLLAAKLGRQLTPEEHAHHGDEDRFNDTLENLQALTAAEHNRHHKTGTRHRPDSRAKTSAALKRLYAEGRRRARPITNRDHLGRITR